MEIEQKKNSSSENMHHVTDDKIIKTYHEEHLIDAKIRRIKDCIVFFVVLTMILGVFGYCVAVIFNVRSLDEEKKWATIVSTAIISVLLGYLVGKSSK